HRALHHATGRLADRRRRDSRRARRPVHRRGRAQVRLRRDLLHALPQGTGAQVSLPAFVVCPACRGELDSLTCRECGRSYREEHDIPSLLDPTAAGLDAKLHELEAWPVLAREQGWYETDDRVDAALPYLNSELGWEDRNW